MKRAYSLIEIAIAITIIALLTAGVLAGAEMVKQAQLKRVIADAYTYIGAVEIYKQKYGELPGDSPNAGAFFAGCAVDALLPGNTCSGDGDGKMLYVDGDLREGWRAFEHLHLAGILSNPLPELGIRAATGGGNNHSVVGQNVPEGIIPGSGYNFGSTNAGFPATYRFGIGTQTAVWVADAALFTHSEAHFIDNKIDNGLPHSGKWTSWGNASCQGDNAVVTAYELGNESVDCSLAYSNIKIR